MRMDVQSAKINFIQILRACCNVPKSKDSHRTKQSTLTATTCVFTAFML